MFPIKNSSPEYRKYSQNSTIGKQTAQLKMSKNLNRRLTKDMRMASRQMIRCSASLDKCKLKPGREGEAGVEGLSKKEKGLIDMDNSVVIAWGGGGCKGT